VPRLSRRLADLADCDDDAQPFIGAVVISGAKSSVSGLRTPIALHPVSPHIISQIDC
jgi:hypothetical protein